ncbi:DUF3237 domain-containing protein [Siccirubricoccus sp. KC 17139]|uniref:UPF0311 protein JYK14_28065 n=1 Tax=Siccirubricoccus soli TaxID=2899147 RepID=A0ABT1DDH0_9PROT|nr:DUF3237 domain-containing protein [Siccirubricoccus soli]MCO6419990.1 DUF3237 domain-containing protein [Siccirubricoccus soli]MCP2686125.1 DUF3237 domain-containing protein [Siccirubricoccus soli]
MAVTPLPLTTEFLFRIVLTAGTPQMSTGPAARGGELRVIPVTGGSFEGPALRGEVVPGTTADWLRVEADGTAHMDVRLVLKTERGQTLYMHYSGVRTGPAEVLARLGRGEAVDAGAYYFRTAVRFETADPELAWLNRVLAVGIGQRPPAGPTYDVYVVR